MISIVQPLPVGNALRLFIQPPVGAVRWKVLRNGNGVFAGHADPAAVLAYDGSETVFVDVEFLQNDVMAFYCPFYTADGTTWAAGQVASGTPAASYSDQTSDVMSELRTRLQAGLLVEVQRGNLMHDLGHIPVFVASPSLDRDLRMPLVTVHLDSEEPSERGLGEMLADDDFDAIGGAEESEGWLASVSLTIIGWSLNGDERLELRKAIRRVIIANLPIFESFGWLMPNLSQQDVDAVGGEYPVPMYQVMNTFTCVAPVRISGGVTGVVTEIFARRSNG